MSKIHFSIRLRPGTLKRAQFFVFRFTILMKIYRHDMFKLSSGKSWSQTKHQLSVLDLTLVSVSRIVEMYVHFTGVQCTLCDLGKKSSCQDFKNYHFLTSSAMDHKL
ncbi:unnamed protein product [Ilex paraguariensis]|uniref:Uncharacterized protein n=1 Tax=Ilex paraguariensis TaxID=185542 RepID=A0ABC8TKR3_9AQUA